MNRVGRVIFYIKHRLTGKPKAIIILRPSKGTTNYLQWLRWKEKYPDCKFYEHNGLFFMSRND